MNQLISALDSLGFRFFSVLIALGIIHLVPSFICFLYSVGLKNMLVGLIASIATFSFKPCKLYQSIHHVIPKYSPRYTKVISKSY